jgi:hypothetical protein
MISVNGKSPLLKISVYLQREFAAETHPAEGLAFVLRWWTSKIELSDQVGTLNQTVSKWISK